MASAGGDEGDPEFQIAPMIDVLLVMLIFFMSITTTQVARVMKEIAIPIASNAAKKQDARDETIINIQWLPQNKKVRFILDERSENRAAAFTDILALRHKADAHHRLVIRCDQLTPARYVSEAMKIAAQAGIADITFAAYPR